MPKELSPVLPSYPPGFDGNVRCDFHARAPGNSDEDCKALKNRVQDLIDFKVFSFMPQAPNINNNALPGHAVPSVNAVEEVAYNRC